MSPGTDLDPGGGWSPASPGRRADPGRYGRLLDRLFASDPGLVRLQTATRVMVSMGSALGVEWAFRRLVAAGVVTSCARSLVPAVRGQCNMR